MTNDKHIFFIPLLLAAFSVNAAAQSMEDKFEQFKQQQNALFNQFVKDKQSEYDSFRKRVNNEYAAFMEKTWQAFAGHPAVTAPETPKIQPVIYEEPKAEPKIEPKEEPKSEPKAEPIEEPKEEPKAKPKEEPQVVVLPAPTPSPEPIAPVQPKEDKQNVKKCSAAFYGTLVSVQFPEPDGFKLHSLEEKDLAAAWKQLSEERYDITLANVLALRQSLLLCDWGYLQLLQTITDKQYESSNEAVFMQAFLMTQSGYKVRLAKNKKNLYLLIACQYDLFGYDYYEVDGQNYYAIDCDAPSLHICPAAVQKEKALSLQIAQTQKLDEEPSDRRALTSKKGVSASVSVNKNQLAFYNQYPAGYLNNDVNTAWVAYANTPLDPKVKEQLYPILQEAIRGKSQKEAANILLNWVQTAFEYAYDDDIWGEDRTFFASETLFYPYCDCEDRSVLFSRIVRDLMHLPVLLVYYPGHLATAVAFTEEVAGDYLTYKNRHYTICDPTFIGAPVGRTMTGMDNNKAKMVVLE